MAKENSQKIKLLKLMELLRQETDEQHPMAATVVCQKLNDMEVACDRRTLTRDIQALNDYGYEVMTTRQCSAMKKHTMSRIAASVFPS